MPCVVAASRRRPSLRRSSAPCRVTSTSSSDEDDAGVAADSEHTSGMSPRRGSSQLCSSLSSENLQRELAQSAAADGLSDQEQVVRRMRLHVKQSPDRLLAAATAVSGREGMGEGSMEMGMGRQEGISVGGERVGGAGSDCRLI